MSFDFEAIIKKYGKALITLLWMILQWCIMHYTPYRTFVNFPYYWHKVKRGNEPEPHLVPFTFLYGYFWVITQPTKKLIEMFQEYNFLRKRWRNKFSAHFRHFFARLRRKLQTQNSDELKTNLLDHPVQFYEQFRSFSWNTQICEDGLKYKRHPGGIREKRPNKDEQIERAKRETT